MMFSRLTLFMCFLFVPALVLSQQTPWQWVNPLPQGNLLNGMSSVGQDTAFGAGGSGTIIKTTNGGSTWQVEQAVAGITDQFFAIQFASPTTGWAVGELGWVVKSTDGGQSWAIQDLPTFRDLYSVSFISTTTGWVAGAAGIILKTTDGGATWAAENSGVTGALYSINFISTTTGWAVGAAGTIVKTTNGGTNWTTQTSGTTQSLYSTEFLSTSVGWASGAFGTVLRTVNGGSSWSVQTTGSIFSLYSIQFSTFLNGWALGAYGEIIKSTNGGVNWFEQTSSTFNDLFCAEFSSSTVGWGMGDLGTIVRTTDGGTTWITQTSGTKNTLNGIWFPSTTMGIAVGEGGTIIRSSDGGLSWNQVASGTFQTLYSTTFINTLIGWTVGDSASVLKTTNGGFNWVEQHTHTDPSLYSVSFANASNGWAVGDFGTILATSNGGTTWTPESSKTSTTLLAVKFADALNGWCVGYSGTILHTTNGGAKWTPQVSGTTRTLYAIDTRSSQNVFISGDFGLVLHTTNGGATWISQTTSSLSSLYALAFTTAQMGWAVGDNGDIVRTTDAGTTWQSQISGTDQTLWGAQIVPASTGALIFAAGYGGTIICSGLSPLPARTWNGSFDSLWTTPANWTPIGVPEKIDSVIIPATTTSPVIRGTIQQINVAALRIRPGARLDIRNGLAQLVIKDDLAIDGTLSFDNASTTEIVMGGTLSRGAGSSFITANTTVVFNGSGQLSGNFYKLVIRENASMQSVNSIRIASTVTLLSDLSLRSFDTLVVTNPDPQAFQGPGIVKAGTVRRNIQQNAIDQYRFESPATYFRFYPTGTYPDTMIVTSFPNSIPPGLPDSLFVRHFYTIASKGGANFIGAMSLHYDTSETAISVDNLSLFRDSSGVVFNMGQSDFLDSDIVAVSLDSITKFSTWYIGRSDYFPKHPLQFIDSLIVADNGGAKDTLQFGAIPGASDSIDAYFGETALGPVPPTGFDSRWLIPPTNGSVTDFRDILSVTHQTNIYTLRVQPGAGGYPMSIGWQVQNLPAGTFFLRDATTHGSVVNVNMKEAPSYSLPNGTIGNLEIVHIAPQYYSFGTSWNMVSIPLTSTSDPRKIRIFPTAVSNAFNYSNGYHVADTLKNRLGYWVKFASPQLVPIDGLNRLSDTIPLADGWNMIGSVTHPVAVKDIQRNPPTVAGQNFFGYSGSYFVTDSVRPSKGYWVKASGSGSLVLVSTGNVPLVSPKSTSPRDLLAGLNKLTVTDRKGLAQTLYFGADQLREIDPEEFELPPLAPEPSFDVRFHSGRMVEAGANENVTSLIDVIATNYPLTIRWSFASACAHSLTLSDQATGKRLTAAAGDGSYVLKDPSVQRITLTVTGSPGGEVPKAFALHQNYPNPFNPSTTIRFDLPSTAKVSVRIFNLLGQEVTAPIRDLQMEAGSHSLIVNGDALATGLYFYQLRATAANGQEFHEVRKMLLMK